MFPRMSFRETFVKVCWLIKQQLGGFFSQKISSSFFKRTETHVCGIVWLGEVRTCETLTHKSAEDNSCPLRSRVEDQPGKTSRFLGVHHKPSLSLALTSYDETRMSEFEMLRGVRQGGRNRSTPRWTFNTGCESFRSPVVGANLVNEQAQSHC